MSELISLVKQIPPVTRSIVLGSLLITALNATTILPSAVFINYWRWTFGRYHLWRPLTAFLVPVGQPMQCLMEIYMCYNYSRGIETGKFMNITAKYAYYLLIVGSLIVAQSPFTNALSFFSPLLSALTYTWAQDNLDTQVMFYFIQFKARHLPFVVLGFRLLIEGSGAFFVATSGMAAAYIYKVLEQGGIDPDDWSRAGKYIPQFLTRRASRSWISTPQWMISLFPQGSIGRTVGSSTVKRPYGTVYKRPDDRGAQAAASGMASRFATNRWGKGHRLGD